LNGKYAGGIKKLHQASIAVYRTPRLNADKASLISGDCDRDDTWGNNVECHAVSFLALRIAQAASMRGRKSAVIRQPYGISFSIWSASSGPESSPHARYLPHSPQRP
jgi:hypothetical protein